jgi:hypothetical protein
MLLLKMVFYANVRLLNNIKQKIKILMSPEHQTNTAEKPDLRTRVQRRITKILLPTLFVGSALFPAIESNQSPEPTHGERVVATAMVSAEHASREQLLAAPQSTEHPLSISAGRIAEQITAHQGTTENQPRPDRPHELGNEQLHTPESQEQPIPDDSNSDKDYSAIS